MRVISFDIGIKNMAYCVFDISSIGLSILDWNILNLMPASNIIKPLCNCLLKNKKQNKQQNKEQNKQQNKEQNKNHTSENLKTCNKVAKYKKGEQLFCDKHAESSAFIKPFTPLRISKNKIGSNMESKNETKQLPCSQTQLKKMNIIELQTICLKSLENNVASGGINNKRIQDMNKKELLDCLQNLLLEPIKPVKEKNAGEMDLITLGRNMTNLLDKLEYIDTIQYVLIENQISPIANRMKTIQGMLCQYFIMKPREPITIEFISSANKLKGFSSLSVSEENKEKSQAGNYKQHKKDGILICSQFLEKNENLKKWKHCLETVKKDDYADGFLQGIWYLKNKKILDYTDYVISMTH